MILWSVHSCFHWCKDYKNRPRNARIIVEDKAVVFYGTSCSSVDIKDQCSVHVNTYDASSCKYAIADVFLPV